MTARASSYVLAVIGVAGIAWLTSAFLPLIGTASSALLFLLPVLFASARGGIGPGLAAAGVGATAYNFFLLAPRFTLRVHQIDNLVSVFVLAAVAVVTSRLATRLKERESEALDRARDSGELAELSAILSSAPVEQAIGPALKMLSDRRGELRFVSASAIDKPDAAFSALDLAAAAWALHNGDITGHGSEVMPAADWTFLPLAPRIRPRDDVAALARPSDGNTRSPAEILHMRDICLLLGQAQDRIALEQERRERERLAETDRLRRTFLAALAHDFRTPLTTIRARLSLLADREPDARDALEEAGRLDRMMNDLLAAARLEAGALTPSSESIDLVDAVSSALDALPVPPHLSVSRTIAPDLPFVRCDPLMLHHVLTNLLDNALRHAAARVTITAELSGETIAISVCDDGPGIPPEDRERIFARFARLEGGDRTSGSGLGLAIVKDFAEAMGMQVIATSGALGGACFRLTIPLPGSAG